MRPFLFSPQRRVYLRRYSGAPPEASFALEVSADIGRLRRPGVFAMAWRGECRALPAETRGDRAPMVPFPLLTPQTLLWTRLPPVARLNARGPQGRSVLQGYALDRSGAFRSAKQAPCTVWPRTVMRGKLRKGNSGHNSVPKAARRTEPSPRLPRLAANALLSGSKEGLGESRGGKGTIRCPFPLLPLSAGAGTPRRRRRHSPAMSWRTSPNPGGPNSPAAASRRNGGTAHPCSREGVKFGVITASFRRRKRTTQPPER